MSNDRTKEVSVKQAAEFVERSEQTIRGWFQRGKIRGRRDGWRILIDYNSLSNYTTLRNRSGVKPFGDIQLKPGEALYPLCGYDYAYATTSNGKIVNLTTGKYLECQPDALDGYVRLSLIKNGKAIQRKEHNLIAQTQCPNHRFKTQIHHVNKVKSDNRPENLLWVTPSEHVKIEKLFEVNVEMYKSEVERIRNDNRCEIFKIPDPDFPGDDCMCLFVDRRGYDAYRYGESVQPENILCQRFGTTLPQGVLKITEVIN